MAADLFRLIKRITYKLRAVILVSGFCVTLIVAAVYVFSPSYLKLLELKLYDTLFEQTYTGSKSDSVVIVDMDVDSLEKFGQWPWPRYRVALLLQKIHMAGALSIGLDILFAEPDGKSPAVLKKAFKKDLNLNVPFSGIPNGLMDNDQVLANVLKMNRNILGYGARFSGKTTVDAKIPDLNEIQIKGPGAHSAGIYARKAESFSPPLPVLMENAASAGFMYALSDADGVIRRAPLIISHQEQLYPSLSLATLLAAMDRNQATPLIKVNRWGIESIKIGKTVVPLDKSGNLLLNYRGPGYTFPYISAGKILEDRIPAGELKGKIVLLGTSAEGLKDIRMSPLDPLYPGVEVHATVIDNILSNDFIHRPDIIPGVEFLLILIWGGITTLMIGWANAIFTLPFLVILGAGAWYGSVWSLDSLKIWISPFFPIMVLVLNFSILNMQKFWLAEKKKKFFRSAFSKYVSKAVVDQLAGNPEKLSLEGEEKNITILFSDIRSFTSISERLSASQVTLLLHDYFTPITEIIIKNQGTHDKFIGDAVMSFWNAPLDVKDHEQAAIKAALEMIGVLDSLNDEFEVKYGIRLAVGIGLHAGKCRVGNMGSKDIFDYTIIGDNVNLASRLEGLTKFYGVQLIVSDTMLKGLTSAQKVQELDRVRVKGRDEPLTIYTVHDPGEDMLEKLDTEISLYADAIRLYRECDFDAATQEFKKLKATYPDIKLYQIYEERCASFKQNPPGKGWDGVYTHTSK